MSQIIWFFAYKLNAGANVEEFLRASARCNKEVLSQQKGFVSWEVLREGDTWVDLCRWESEQDAKNAESAGQGNPAAMEFYSFIDMESCVVKMYTVETQHGV